VRDSLKIIEDARSSGLDVTADQYPYTSGSTALAAILQNNAFNDRASAGGTGSTDGERVRIAAAARHPEYEGKTIAELSRRFGLSEEATARRIVEEEQGGAMAIIEMMDENDVRTVMRHPTTMIGSDGLPVGGKPHPRLYGTFPRVIGRYARELKLFSIEEAVHRMTGFPAVKFGLAGRGIIREGAIADLVVFDPQTLIDTATYDSPCEYPPGICHVFVNGTAVVRDCRHTGARPGRAIRFPNRD
jgi:dihydroorotase/N-acyl-D-amino-acid deacylase